MKTHSKARLISLVTVLAMMLVLCFALAAPASAASYEVGTAEDLKAKIEGAAKGDKIYLTNDIVLDGITETITISKAITITSKQDETDEDTEIYTITRVNGGFPMFTIAAGGTYTLTNVTFDGADVEDTTSIGGCFSQTKASLTGVYLNIGDGATIKNFHAKQGGGVYARCVIVLEGGVVENCTSVDNGGGIYAIYQFTMSGGTVQGNTAGGNGGGIYCDNTGTNASKNVTGGTIQNNTAGKSGGGIHITTGATTCVVAGVTITGNTAASYGGGVSASGSGTITMESGTISCNKAANGGGIGGTNNAKPNIALSGTQVLENTAANGGGISLAGATLTMTGGAIKSNTSTNNSTDVGGGGVYATGTSTVTVSGGEISGNTAVRGGGMLLLCNATFEGGTIKENTATGSGGGGLYLAGSEKTVTIGGSTVIADNRAEAGEGGGIYLKAIALDITGGTISGNVANQGGGIGMVVKEVKENGVVVNVILPTLTMSSGEVKGNVALIGSKEGHGGAGLYVVGTATLSGNAAIIENKINNLDKGYAKGGGIFVTASGILTIQDAVRVDNNFVAACTLSGMSYGGGIYNNGGFVVMDGGSISGNLAYNNSNCTYGGGIYNLGVFIMNGGSVNGNVIMSGNGARYNRGGAVANGTGATFWMTGGEMCGNRALGVGSDGGAIYVNGGVVYVTGGTVADNGMAYTSKKHGGAMYISATAYLAGGEFHENHHYKTTIKSTALTADAEGNYSKDCALVSFVRNADGSMEIKTVASEKSGSTETSRNEHTITVTGATTGKTQSQINVGGTAYLGATITLSEALGDDVKAALENVTVSEDGLTVTTANKLNISSQTAQPAFINNTAEKLILASALVDGSYVAMKDSEAAFMGVAEGVTDVEGICLLGADAQYAPKLADGALTWPTDPYFVYQNAGLRDDIAYRLYFVMRNKTDALTVTYKGETVALGTVSETLATAIGEPTYEGLSYAELLMAPKEMTETVTVTLGEAVKELTLAKYVASLKGRSTELDALVDAMLNYGSAAQLHFNHNADTPANPDFDAQALAAVPTTEVDLSNAGGNFDSAFVDVGSRVSLAIVVKAGKSVSSVDCGEYAYEITDVVTDEDGNQYYAVTVKNIAAKDLLNAITVTLEDNTSLTYSVPMYASRMQGASDIAPVVKALYAYAVAAREYDLAN